ncbi:DUF3549 family protein [Halomonas sp. Bachu 37]|uniref:DUF3549 family protein n=1 Tax=Halomonas kashgarensis TaxID=3084920 RepID=UPI0032177096
MQPIHTLDDFFSRSGAEVLLYHMGRRVTPCARRHLTELESGQSSWPEPWQGKAQLAIVFRLGDMPEPAIWFLALPLDETGLLDPAPRDAFLQRLLETLGRNATATDGLSDQCDTEAVDHLMKDNPLAFTPSLPFQAMLHARASRDLGQAASSHLEPVEAYLSRQQQVDWQGLGLQGLADFVVRMDDEAAQQLAQTLDTLPDPVLHSTCYCLEHVVAPLSVVAALQQRGDIALAQDDVETLCACVRASSGSESAHVGLWLDALLADTRACGPDLLAAIAARGWHHLEDAQRLPSFLERLAQEPRANFATMIRDLALIPRLRLPLVMHLRDAPEGSIIKQRLAALSTSATRD